MALGVVARSFKPIALSALYHLGFFELIRLLQRKRVTILMYHRFSGKTEPFKLSQKVFSRQLHYLSRKYSIISFNEYVQVLQGARSSLPPNPMIITIDDGYQDNYEYAYPVLKKYNVPATIFLTTDFISRKAWMWSNTLEYILKNTSKVHFSFSVDGTEQTFHVDTFAGWHRTQLVLFNYCRNLSDITKKQVLMDLFEQLKVKVPEETTREFSPLTWAQIRKMQEFCIEYGSHTCTHPIMSRLTDQALEYELQASKREIEKETAAPVRVFCYPNGTKEDFSDKVIKAVQNAFYKAAVTTMPGFNTTASQDPFTLKRISITTADQKQLTARLNRG